MQAYRSSAMNPPISMLFRLISSVEWLVLGVTGFSLLLLPSFATAQWPWQVTPFNTTFLGAVYIASFAAITGLLWAGHWAPARLVLWLLVSFTTLVLIISVVYLGRFDFHKWATWAWFFLYIVIPLDSAYHLYLYRHQQPANPTPLPSLFKWYLLVQASVLSLYTLALLIAPVASTAFWPWHIDEFHARIYSSIFLTLAVGAYVLWRSASAVELLLLGVTQSVFGFFATLGLVIVNTSQHRVNWAQPGTLVWIGLFAVLLLTGIVQIVFALGKHPVWQQERIYEGHI